MAKLIIKNRQKKLLSQLESDSIAMIASAPQVIRNGDAHYPYRQNSSFYYLTGFPEPEAVAVFIPDGANGKMILFCRERDEAAEIWVGPRAGQEGAIKEYGADEAYPIHEFTTRLKDLLKEKKRIYYPLTHAHQYDQNILSYIDEFHQKARTGIEMPHEFIDLDFLISEMRLFKDEHEIKLMQHAADISAEAQLRAIKACQPNIWEYELEAELLHEYFRQGARAFAYEPIVASGANACILHYTQNNAQCKAGDLVLIDAACEYDLYAADITRTFPVNGHFSKEQKVLYELVLEAQLAGIDVAKPGNPWALIQKTMVEIIAEGLIKLGILSGNLQEVIDNKYYQRFYMHNSGHWLGMDVHDVGSYKQNQQWRVLSPGIVLTIEPGIYISPNCEDVNPKWRGIGIRIEDDVHITKDGNEILSKAVPKQINEIEALMQQ